MTVRKNPSTSPKPKHPKSKQHRNPAAGLSAYGWEPTTDDERERWRRGEPWFTFWPQLTDDDAKALLSRILALRQTKLRSPNAGLSESREALQLSARLIEGAIGWAVADYVGMSHIWAYRLKSFDESPEDWDLHKLSARDSLSCPVTLMLPMVRTTLAEALDKLFDGVVHPMLTRAKGGRRGVAGRKRAYIQLNMLAWIEWQIAGGHRPEMEALNLVAKACNRSDQAIRNWERDLKKKALKSSAVEDELEKAREIGRIECMGHDPGSVPELASMTRRLRSLDLQVAGRDRQ